MSGEAVPLDRRRPSTLAMIGWVAFAMLLLYAVLFGGGYIGINDPRWHLLSLTLIGIALVVWALVAWRDPRWRPGTAIWPALVVPLASLGLSTALSPYPRLGIEYLAWAVLLVALYLLLVRILATETVRIRIGGLALVLGLAMGVFYLSLVTILWLDWWSMLGRFEVPPLRPGHVGLPFGGPNIVASAMVLVTVLAYAGLGFATRGRKVALGILTAIAIAAVLISASRSSWLASAAAIGLVGGLWLVVNRRLVMGRLSDRQGRLVIGGGVVAVVVSAIAVGPIVLDRLINSGDGGRPSYFAAALRMFEDAPLTGLGPGGWAAQRIAYLAPDDLDYSVPHAHNIYLQTAAELGIVGLAAGLIAVVSVLWLVYRALRSADRRRHAWAWAVLFGLVYLAVVDMADFYANLPGIVVLAIVPLAMLDGLAERGIGVPVRLATPLAGRISALALVVACAVAVATLAWADSTALTSGRATRVADGSDWAAASEAAAEAVAADPSHPQHQLVAATMALREQDWATAIEAYERSTEVDDLPQAWLGLALATLEAGGAEADVVASIEAGLRMGRQHAHVNYAAAELYDRLGMSDAADAAYVDALVRLPGLAADPYWDSDPGLSSRFAALLDKAIAGSDTAGWRLALMAGETEQAASLAETDPLASDVVAAWGGDAEALERMEARVVVDPKNAGLLATTATLVERAGDEETAKRYRRMALLAVEHVWTLGREVHTTESCEDGDRVEVRSDSHGLWAYRRSTPRELMPPQIRCFVYPASGSGLDQTAP